MATPRKSPAKPVGADQQPAPTQPQADVPMASLFGPPSETTPPPANTEPQTTINFDQGRGIRWVWRSRCGTFGVIHITTKEGSWDYFIQFFVGYYELSKIEPLMGLQPKYKVVLPVVEGCTCMGYKTHKHCKHVLGLACLREKNKL